MQHQHMKKTTTDGFNFFSSGAQRSPFPPPGILPAYPASQSQVLVDQLFQKPHKKQCLMLTAPKTTM